MYALPLSSTSPSRRDGVLDPNAGAALGKSASKKPSAMWLLGLLGLLRVSPKPATAPPPTRSICCSTKLGDPGMSNWALAQLTPNTTGSLLPLVMFGTSAVDRSGAPQPDSEP